MLLEALVSVGMLIACAAWFRARFDGPYIILALLVFSLMFPGRAPQGTSAGAVAREVLAGWVLVVGLLLMLGWATRTIGSFDPRVVTAWVVLTPVALVASHLAMPVLLPRLLAVEGLTRVAVIAGGGALGRKLAERIASTPFAGI